MIFASSLNAFARPAAFSSADSPPIILASVLAGGEVKFAAFVFEPAAPVAAASIPMSAALTGARGFFFAFMIPGSDA